MESPVHQRVLVIGGGVAGAVFALLLKQKGWQPIILEKVGSVGVAGLGLVLQSNGMKVLNKAGVVDVALDGTLPWKNWNDWSYQGNFLGGPGSKSAGNFIERYGWPAVGLSRSQLQIGLKSACERASISFIEGWKLKNIEVENDHVAAVSEDGRVLHGAFVVGADGLKSATRDVILARHGHPDREPSFTGIKVIGGLSPSPQFLKDRQGLNLFWGPSETIVTHPIENGQHVWGATVPVDKITQEIWRTLTSEEMKNERHNYLAQWSSWHPVIAELLETAVKMQTIGLYERGDLDINHWSHDRMILIGDAAHPMTPHAGQGANQAIEDAWELSEKLPPFREDSPITIEELSKLFRMVAEERQPRTSSVMHKALKWGEDRVLRGDRATAEGEKARNDALIRKWNDIEFLRREQDEFLQGPFDDRGGYQKWLEVRTGTGAIKDG